MKKCNQHPGKRSKLAWPIAAIVALTPGLLSSSVFAQAGALEEIVVTAQRREQAIQDVPISITAFSAEDLVSRNIENVENLNILLPNVMIRGGGTTGPTQGNFTMRGVPGVARYLDGVAQTSTNGSLANVVELQRIEVLKGPQGTLFGKNAMGGAISYVSRAPAEEFGARIIGTMGNFNQKQLTANVDIPLSDDFLTKVTYFTSQKDGYVASGITGVDHGDENDTVLRFDSLWHASQDVDVRFDITSNQRNPRYMQADVLYDVVETQGMVVNYNNNGFPFTDATDAFGKIEQYQNSSLYSGPGWIFDATSANVTIDWNINDYLALRSITGARKIDSQTLSDLDASRYQFFEIFTHTQSKEKSQEFQLLGDGDKFDWVLGFYANSVDSTSRRFDFQFVEFAPRNTNWITENEQADTSLFFEGTYDITNDLSVTVGGRYSEEDTSGGQWDADSPIPTWPDLSHTFVKGPATNISADTTFYKFTPRLSAQYSWTDDIMTYATYAEGFNGGGVNVTPNPDGSFGAYTGETLKQFELGFRSTWFNNSLRLNAAYFDGTWEDMLVGEALVPGRIVQTNAGEAEISGFELDVVWAVTDDFQLNISGGLLDTAYTELGTTTTIALNSSFAFAPEKQYSAGAQYDINSSNGDVVSIRADYGWTDEFVTIQDIRLQKLQESYGLLSGRITYTPLNADWNLAIWGRNLTNEWYQLGGFGAFLGGVDQGVVSRPREYGLTLSMEF
tara:strand:+ start:58754 stop:60952 length:2199 start_codon:yes stop_codon:yes gene_type:complete